MLKTRFITEHKAKFVKEISQSKKKGILDASSEKIEEKSKFKDTVTGLGAGSIEAAGKKTPMWKCRV